MRRQRLPGSVQGRAARLLAFACVSALLCGVPARAQDNIDKELPAKARTVLRWLKKHDVHTVGVLKFRVQKGSGPESFTAGAINANLATRLENALTLAQEGEESPIGIIHDAGAAISRRKEHVSYLSAEDVTKLFSWKYPLAWGDKQVVADAFLTGLVRLSPSRKQATVVVEAIEKAASKRTEVLTFSVDTDRTVLSDLGEGFVISVPRLRAMGVSREEPEIADTDDPKPISTPTPSPTVQDSLVELQVMVDNVPAPQTAVGANTFHMPEPKSGQRVTFRLKNRHKERVGVVLAVNGINTLHEENIADKTPKDCSKWILQEQTEYVLKGFYQKDGTKYKEFRVLEDDPSQLEYEMLNTDPKLGKLLGAIQMFVFLEGKGTQVVQDTPKVVAQGLRKSLPNTAKTAQEAADLLRQSQASRIVAQGFIKPGEKTGEADLKSTGFKDPQFQEGRRIVYFDKAKKTPRE